MSPARGRLRPADLLAAGAAAALVADLFAPWYSRAGRLLSAWEAAGVLSVYLLVAALASLAAAALVARSPIDAPAVVAGVLALALDVAGTLLVAVRLAAPPGGTSGRCAGVYLGLALAALAAWATYRSLHDERAASPEARARTRALLEGAERVPAPPGEGGRRGRRRGPGTGRGPRS